MADRGSSALSVRYVPKGTVHRLEVAVSVCRWWCRATAAAASTAAATACCSATRASWAGWKPSATHEVPFVCAPFLTNVAWTNGNERIQIEGRVKVAREQKSQKSKGHEKKRCKEHLWPGFLVHVMNLVLLAFPCLLPKRLDLSTFTTAPGSRILITIRGFPQFANISHLSPLPRPHARPHARPHLASYLTYLSSELPLLLLLLLLSCSFFAPAQTGCQHLHITAPYVGGTLLSYLNYANPRHSETSQPLLRGPQATLPGSHQSNRQVCSDRCLNRWPWHSSTISRLLPVLPRDQPSCTESG